MGGLRLNTVCQEAMCPNLGECWSHGVATFMILGDICTRGCRYCAVSKGKPLQLDQEEPHRVAEAVEAIAGFSFGKYGTMFIILALIVVVGGAKFML